MAHIDNQALIGLQKAVDEFLTADELNNTTFKYFPSSPLNDSLEYDAYLAEVASQLKLINIDNNTIHTATIKDRHLAAFHTEKEMQELFMHFDELGEAADPHPGQTREIIRWYKSYGLAEPDLCHLVHRKINEHGYWYTIKIEDVPF